MKGLTLSSSSWAVTAEICSVLLRADSFQSYGGTHGGHPQVGYAGFLAGTP